MNYEGDPRSNANPSVIFFKFAIIKKGVPVYYDILSILLNQITFFQYITWQLLLPSNKRL